MKVAIIKDGKRKRISLTERAEVRTTLNDRESFRQQQQHQLYKKVVHIHTGADKAVSELQVKVKLCVM